MVETETNLLDVGATADVVTVELSRPDKLNALVPEMIEGLLDLCDQLHEDPGPAMLVTGAGRATCAGMDRDIVGGGSYESAYGNLDETLGRLYERVATYPGPVAIAGHGALVGAGAVLSLYCEILVIGDDTTLGFPEVQFDIASERIATRLPELVGRRVAAELALTGEPIEPDRAKTVGLATDVVPEAAVEGRARDILETIVGHDRETVARLIDLLE